MSPPKPPPPPLSAPGLVGPISILNQPVSGPRSGRRAHARPYAHARLEGTLPEESGDLARLDPVLRRAAALFEEKKVGSNRDFWLVSMAVLHAFSARRFRWVDHWELSPGGWLPVPARRASVGRDREPIGHLLDSLGGGAWSNVLRAKKFAVRLSDLRGNRADVVLRRGRPGAEHGAVIDLWGSWTKTDLHELTEAVASRLPGTRLELTKYQYE